jgi:hypothetical protein
LYSVLELDSLLTASSPSFVKMPNLFRIFYLWRAFLGRRRIMDANDSKRRTEIIALILARWKVYAAIERMCKSSRRRKLLKSTFTSWRATVNDALFERKADQMIAKHKERKIMKKVFSAWQSQTCYLEWSSDRLQILETFALRHYMMKVLHAWRAEAVQGRLRDEDRALALASLPLRAPFRLWSAMCRVTWRRRRTLMHRFFANMGSAIFRKASRAAPRNVRLQSERAALVAGVRCRRALTRWLRHTRLQLHLTAITRALRCV